MSQYNAVGMSALDLLRRRQNQGQSQGQTRPVNHTAEPGRVNPSGPALDRRNQRDGRLRDAGVDPVMLRQELHRRRTSDEAVLRQRRSLGRKAQLLEQSGDRAAAEQVRAEIALLEGARVEQARGIANDAALIRGGESRLSDADRLAQIRQRQELERRRVALGRQEQETDLAVADREIRARDLDSQRALTETRTGAREAGIAETVSERTAGTRTETGIQDSENRLLQLQAEQEALQDQLVNAPNDRAVQREAERLELERRREENRLARLRAQTEADAEAATAEPRVEAATEQAQTQAIRARRDRERLEQGAPGADVVTEIYGPDMAPADRAAAVAEIRAPAVALREAFRRGWLGGMPRAGSDQIDAVRGMLDFLANRRAALDPQQYEALVAYVRSEIEREGIDLSGAAPVRVGNMNLPGTLPQNPTKLHEFMTAWRQLRRDLGVGGDGG